jgi:hypothetical protein
VRDLDPVVREPLSCLTLIPTGVFPPPIQTMLGIVGLAMVPPTSRKLGGRRYREHLDSFLASALRSALFHLFAMGENAAQEGR